MNQGIWDKITAKIKWLRTQPEGVKNRFVWVAALAVFLVIVGLWVGFFRKYERRADDGVKNAKFLEEMGKIRNDIGTNVKIPDISLPEMQTPAPKSENPQ